MEGGISRSKAKSTAQVEGDAGIWRASAACRKRRVCDTVCDTVCDAPLHGLTRCFTESVAK